MLCITSDLPLRDVGSGFRFIGSTSIGGEHSQGSCGSVPTATTRPRTRRGLPRSFGLGCIRRDFDCDCVIESGLAGRSVDPRHDGLERQRSLLPDRPAVPASSRTSDATGPGGLPERSRGRRRA